MLPGSPLAWGRVCWVGCQPPTTASVVLGRCGPGSTLFAHTKPVTSGQPESWRWARCGRGRGAPELAPKPQVCTGKRTSTPRAVTTNFRNRTGGQSETIFEVYEKFSSLLPSLGSVRTEADQVGPLAAKVRLSPQGARGGVGVSRGDPQGPPAPPPSQSLTLGPGN